MTVVPGRIAERGQETAERARELEEHDREELALVRTSLNTSLAPVSTGHFREDLYGAFAADHGQDGRIALRGEAAESAERLVADFHRDAKAFSNLAAGERIAAEYETRTNNFRAQTRLDTLSDGRKVFMIYDYKGSFVHRFLDGMMKRLNGLPMAKVDRKEWKRQQETKTAIPVIENADPHMAMMPYVPNANGKDVFANNAEIESFGTCAWAKESDLEEKNALSGRIMDEMKRFHDVHGGWGEAVLSNVIFTEDKNPVLCDFEVAYGKKVSLAEAKARDVKDMCMSVAAALEAAHGQDNAATVKTLLDRYADPEVLAELKRLASKKRGVLGTIFFGYEQARTGTKSKKQYDAILKAIR